jgi:hypothetical protein
MTKKSATGAFCVFCGAVIVAGNFQAHGDCQPRAEACSPPAIKHADLPEREPAPVKTVMQLEVVSSASASLSMGVGPIFFVKSPPRT